MWVQSKKCNLKRTTVSNLSPCVSGTMHCCYVTWCTQNAKCAFCIFRSKDVVKVCAATQTSAAKKKKNKTQFNYTFNFHLIFSLWIFKSFLLPKFCVLHTHSVLGPYICLWPKSGLGVLWSVCQFLLKTWCFPIWAIKMM